MPSLYPAYLQELTERLCSVPSISGAAAEENACALMLKNEIERITPSFGHRLETRLIDCENDPLGRQAVLAVLTCRTPTERTVLLTGHFDVVDTQALGALSGLAFSPSLFTHAVRDVGLDPESLKDLESGNWLFGRGTMDMKAGLALFVGAIGHFAHEENLAINIAFLAVPDEEVNSAGMRGAMPEFTRLMNERHWDVVAALTGEPCFWTKGTATSPAVRPYYTGSTGKIMPYFMCLGVPAHVNDYYSGLSAALLAARVVEVVEANDELVDGEGFDTLSPPCCLELQVRRDTYSVTLPQCAVAYFNVLTTTRTPADVLEWCKNAASTAAARTIEHLARRRAQYRARGGNTPELPEIRVIDFSDVCRSLIERWGSAEATYKRLTEYADALPKGLDAREASIRIAEFMVEQAHIATPCIVVGFVPPYYPYRLNTNRTPKERKLRQIVNDMAKLGGEMAGDNATMTHEVFGGITDLSFLGFDGDERALSALSQNMPGWGSVYSLPMQELLQLDIPVANMGPAGKDAHKKTERLELKYSFEIAPELLRQTIVRLGQDS